MPQYIVKLEHEGTPYYLMWSTVVDAPITYGMTLDEFKSYYHRKHGDCGMQELGERLERVEAKGTSSMVDESGDEVISLNRAGKDETQLTKEQIIQWYCIERRPCEIVGEPFWNAEEE